MMLPLVTLHVTATVAVSPVLVRAIAVKSSIWSVRSVAILGATASSAGGVLVSVGLLNSQSPVSTVATNTAATVMEVRMYNCAPIATRRALLPTRPNETKAANNSERLESLAAGLT